mgnify:FL=1
MAEEPITVLLVDDDEQWARYLASELEDAAPDFSVTVVLNVNEAVLALDDDRSIDCIVTDFRMPEVDGIQLLEHLQESHPHLPVILVTGDGSEDVAARAINAGVTDYIRKDLRTDQTPLFVTRIRQAVERARLQTAVRESEHRYRTVVEQTRDAIVVLRDGDVVFANDRFRELCGPAREADSGVPVPCVHEDDHQRVRDVVSAARAGEDSETREVRVVRPSGAVRHCELVGGPITYESDDATLLSIRDVTLRRARERTLERAREFNRAVQQLLVDVRTRHELEAEIATVLASFGYDMVWLGTAVDGRVRTRATAGDDDYVGELEADTPGDDHGGDPIRWSARTGEPRYVPDFEALMPTARRDDVLESGFRTGCALPLRHEDIAYGTLAVYHTEPHWIDEVERSLLAEVAETVSFAIHHVETHRSLTSAERVVVEVATESTEYYLPHLLGERFEQPAVEVRVDGTHAVDEETHAQYLSCSGVDTEAFADALESHPSVRSKRVVDSVDPVTYRVAVDGDTPESLLGAIGALVRSTTVTHGRATITFELASRSSLQPVINRLNERYGPVTVRSVVDATDTRARDGVARVDVDSLTEKQAAALEAAYQQGYFDRPRRHTAVDVADSLGITHTTYLQHLRVAQRKVFRQLFGDDANDRSNDSSH